MSEQASIDGLAFAREAQRLAGEFAVAELPRLDDLVFERAGAVSYSLAGSTDRHGKALLDITVEGTLPLVCQRCLGRLDFRLQRQSRLILIAQGQVLPDVSEEAPEIESVPAESVANVADLVEQEVLLGLPIAPMHAAGSCAASTEDDGGRPSSPFAVLEQLKKPRAAGD